MDLTSSGGRARLLVAAGALFVVATIVAMLVYPGGAVFEEHASHYLFFGNFFSDLGATETVSGHSNIASHVLFIIALGSVGLVFAWSAPSWNVWGAAGRARVALRIADVVAVLSGFGFVGIAVTPWNHVLDAHNLFVRLAFGLLLVFIVCLTIVQIANRAPREWIVVNVVYLVVLAAYVVILFAGPKLDTRDGLRFQVAAQKIIVYASVVNLSVQAFAVARRSREPVPAAR